MPFSSQPTSDLVDAESLPDLQDRLQRYARGESISFNDLTFDLSACGPFQQSVLKIVGAIPYGQTRTYAQVAQTIGWLAAMAV